MRLGLVIGYSTSQLHIPMDLVLEAEKLGFDSVWTAEAWGADAVTPLAWIAAQTTRIRLGTGIMQIPGRSPANTAMTAMTLDALSGGRFILGLGTSGPQVVEGWHGMPFERPFTWLKEYVAIVRKALARDEPLTFDGERYQIPYRGPGSTGQGKALKSILHGRTDIPIYTGSMAPKSQAWAAENLEGVLLTCMNPDRPEAIYENIEEGFARAGDKGWDDFDLAPTVAAVMGDDLEACRLPLRYQLALYIGGMGSRKTNFYNAYLRRAGFEAEAIKIQDLYLAGKKNEAIAAVTDELVDALYLVGPKERIAERFAAWKETRVGTLVVGTHQIEVIRLLAELNG
jgi:F420-dependent oxidoreductase-like protein